MLIALHYISVLIFGILIMVFFLDIKISWKTVFFISTYVVFSTIVQYVLYANFGLNFVSKSYPLVIHVPLIVLFCSLFKKRLDSVLFVLFTAYALTSPRKWIGDLFASLFFNNNTTVSIITQIISTIVLLFLIYKYLRPFVIRVLEYSGASITLLTIMPALFYVVAYATTVYTDTLYHSNYLLVGSIGIGILISVSSYLYLYINEMSKIVTKQTEQAVLQLQVDTTMSQIKDYKNSQIQAEIYRHDLRHHLNYIHSCIAERQLDEVQDYITSIISNVEKTRVVQYCDNTTINLLLSAYVAQAKNNKVSIDVYALVPVKIFIHSTDICVILGNGIENAIHACMKIDNALDRKLSITCKYEDNKLMIKIINPFIGKISFKGDTPISFEKNHSFGVSSIKAAVDKYRGVYSFTTKNTTFELLVVLYGNPN